MRNGFAKAMFPTPVAALALLLGSAIALADSAERSIRELLMDAFDKPGAPLVVDPVVVANDHAIADWVQDGHGGRALLRRRDGKWSLILCSGDGIKSAAALQKAGVGASDAADLAARLQTAESTISSGRRAMLSTFEGTVVMGDDPREDRKQP
jgi:hypothetical protein